MRIGVFTMTVVALLLLLASLNSYWLGRLLRPERQVRGCGAARWKAGIYWLHGITRRWGTP